MKRSDSDVVAPDAQRVVPGTGMRGRPTPRFGPSEGRSEGGRARTQARISPCTRSPDRCDWTRLTDAVAITPTPTPISSRPGKEAEGRWATWALATRGRRALRPPSQEPERIRNLCERAWPASAGARRGEAGCPMVAGGVRARPGLDALNPPNGLQEYGPTTKNDLQRPAPDVSA